MKNFLNTLFLPGTITQVGTLDRVLAISGAELTGLNLNQNLFFLGGVDPKRGHHRAEDADIIGKKYLAIDFDLRKHGFPEDADIIVEADRMATLLEENGYLWRYQVFSGNGVHFYFTFPPVTVTPALHTAALKELHHRVEALTGQKPDPTCVNSARVFRLPGSFNMKNPKSPKPVEVLVQHDRDSALNLNQLAQAWGERMSARTVAKKLPKDAAPLFEAICRIPIRDEVVPDFPDLRFDGKNFRDETGKRKGFWISEETNLLISGGSDHVPFFTQHEGFNTFSYRKEKDGLTAKETFAYFKSRYPALKGVEEGIIAERKTTAIQEVLQNRTLADPLNGGSLNPITWGTPGLDHALAGIESHHYVLLGGESGSGKTTYAFFFAMQNAQKGIPVLFLSLEEQKSSLVARFARARAGIGHEEWHNRAIQPIDPVKKTVYERRFEEIRQQENLTLVGGADFTEEKNMDFIKDIIIQSGAKLAIIDNFNKIASDPNVPSVQHENTVSHAFLDFTNTHLIPCVVIHHYAKKKGAKDERGANSFRGSQKIVDDSDIVAVYKRDFDSDTAADITVFKDRDFSRIKSAEVHFSRGDFVDNDPL